MADIVLRVLDGADRGRTFENLRAPVTVGREEGNTIQLNDERVSRFHIKIQEDNDKVVLTDLESTNGTKVNGDDVQLRILRFGDTITVGHSVLLYGSPGQIAQRLAELRGGSTRDAVFDGSEDNAGGPDVASLDFELAWNDDPDAQATLHALIPPDLPERLSPAQAAQVSELLEYIHLRLRGLLDTVKMETEGRRVTLDMRQWQSLIDLQARLAGYLRAIGEPE